MLKKLIQKIFKAFGRHKIITAISIIIVAVGVYYGYSFLKGNTNTTSYVLAAVEKGTLIISVSGTGQVSASNQIDIKPKVSGDATYVGIKNGQDIKAGALLAQIDSQDAQIAVRDAQASLDSARLSLQKLQQPPDQLSILQAQNALTQAEESKQNAEENLKKSYDDGFNTVTNAFLDLPSVMSGINDILFDSTLSGNASWNIDYYADAVTRYDEKAIIYRDSAYAAYNTARASYDKNFDDYKSASRFSDESTIESLIIETYDTTRNIAEAVRNASNLIQFYKDKLAEHNLEPLALADTHLSGLDTDTGKTNSHIGNLLSIKNSIQNGKQTIINSDRTIAEKTQSLANLQAGPDSLDLQSQQLTIQQRENALLDAKQKLADYSVRAPFDGIVTNVNIKKGDSVSGGTAIATLITKQSIAEISLNEVDVAKVKIGQKVTLTFDAIDSLNMTGEVADIDALGTVTQGALSATMSKSALTRRMKESSRA